MKKAIALIAAGLIVTAGCADRAPIITIVDIGYNDRIEIGKQLRVINGLSPKIIALDFHLVPDSLDIDSILVKELETAKNTVQIVGLHDLFEPEDIWDSLEVSHPKFKVSNHGFSNLTCQDSVFLKELPMQQLFGSKPVYSFSYVVAQNSFGVKPKYKDKGTEELKLTLKGLGKNYKLIRSNELLSGNFNKDDLIDKIVIMGYIGEKEDYFYVDRERKTRVNGVEVHAAIIDEIIDL